VEGKVYARNRFFGRVGIVIGGLFLVQYWTMAIHHWNAGHLIAYHNYWNAPVGTITLFIVLLAATPMWLWIAVTKWNWPGRHEVDER
jgi:hypothetical protein